MCSGPLLPLSTIVSPKFRKMAAMQNILNEYLLNKQMIVYFWLKSLLINFNLL